MRSCDSTHDCIMHCFFYRQICDIYYVLSQEYLMNCYQHLIYLWESEVCQLYKSPISLLFFSPWSAPDKLEPKIFLVQQWSSRRRYLNGFPSHMFDCIVRHFLDNTFQPKPSILTAPKKIIYFCLPFTGSHSLQIRTQINRLCNAAFPHLDIRFVFRSSTRISSFFPFKDKVPKFLRSGVVYSFKCRCCSASYVGQTTRHLHTRISEHLGISPITGKPSSSPAMSSIFSHINSSGHSASFDDFKIISSSSDSYELMIHESLLISKLKPSLNVQGSSIPLNLF